MKLNIEKINAKAPYKVTLIPGIQLLKFRGNATIGIKKFGETVKSNK